MATIPCDECSRTFTTQQGLLVHLARAHGQTAAARHRSARNAAVASSSANTATPGSGLAVAWSTPAAATPRPTHTRCWAHGPVTIVVTIAGNVLDLESPDRDPVFAFMDQVRAAAARGEELADA